MYCIENPCHMRYKPLHKFHHYPSPYSIWAVICMFTWLDIYAGMLTFSTPHRIFPSYRRSCHILLICLTNAVISFCCCIDLQKSISNVKTVKWYLSWQKVLYLYRFSIRYRNSMYYLFFGMHHSWKQLQNYAKKVYIVLHACTKDWRYFRVF